jgi:hypothetical protein
MLLLVAHHQARVLLHVLHVLQQRHLSRDQQHQELAPAVTTAAALPPGVR